MARFDRNQFLLLAGAIGAATAAIGSKSYSNPETVEEDQTTTCDGDTGQTGWSKYCPMSEGHRKGCLESGMCIDLGLKAGSELRYFDCLANAPTSACASEGAGNAYLRCSQQVVNHACADPLAAQTCLRATRVCGGQPGRMMQESCAIYLTPLTPAGRSQFLSCMVEGSCGDDQFKSCVPYLR